MEDSFFGQKETGAERVAIVVPSFKKTALIFLEILFFQHFTIFSYKQYDVITDLICIIEKR